MALRSGIALIAATDTNRLHARITGGKAGVFGFAFPKSSSGHLYRLNAHVADQACTGLTWHGPPSGYVVGGGSALTLGAELTGAIQVYAGGPSFVFLDGKLRNNWANDDNVPRSLGADLRTFHWSSAINPAAVGQWQVTTSDPGTSCGQPSGLVASGSAPYHAGPLQADSTASSFAIDFAKVTSVLNPGDGPQEGTSHFGSEGGPTPTTTAKNGGPLKASDQVGNAPVVPLPDFIGFKGTYYVRVVPVDATGKCLGDATNSAIISYGLPGSLPVGDTKLEVYATADYINVVDNPSIQTLWKSATGVDFDSETTGHRHFHWSSTAPGVASGEWQLSSGPFSPGCADSPGLLAAGQVPFGGNATLDPQDRHEPPVFTIDFHDLPTPLAHDVSYHIRIVPRLANGKTCAGTPSHDVVINHVPTGPAYTIPELPPAFPPPPLAPLQVEIFQYQPYTSPKPIPPYCFQALIAHDVDDGVISQTTDLVGQLAVHNGDHPAGHFDAGDRFCFNPPGPEKSVFDQAVNFVLDVVSFPSEFYEAVKDAVVAIAATLIQIVGVDCKFPDPKANFPELPPQKDPGEKSWCSQALKSALEVGLEAIGLPPSLPDARAMVEDGENYLVAQIADQTGVPEPVVKATYDYTKAKILEQLNQASSSSGFPCLWCIPDEDARLPVAEVRVARPLDDPQPTLVTATGLCVRDETADAHRVYDTSCAGLPAKTGIPAGSSFVVPLHLKPHFDQKEANKAYSDCVERTVIHADEPSDDKACADAKTFQLWYAERLHGPVPMTLTASATRPYEAYQTVGAPYQYLSYTKRDAEVGSATVTIDPASVFGTGP